MKILRVIPTVDLRSGGPMEGARKTDAELVSRGHEITVASLDAESSVAVLTYPGKIFALGPPKSKYGYAARLAPWLRANATQYDVVIVNGIWQYHSFATYRALRNSATPYFVYTHGMLDPWFKHKFPLKHFKKFVYWILAEYHVLKNAKGVIFTCEQEKILARESFGLYSCRELVTTYGTAAPVINETAVSAEFLEKFPQVRGKRVILFLSRIHEKKGCDLLVEAFAKVARKHPDLHLVVAGPDKHNLTPKLASRARALGVESQVSWVGMLVGDEKWGAFSVAEAFILPSHQENFGIAVAEAMACGKPVLISDKVNIWREIEEDRAGFVSADTLEGTLEILEKWLALNVEERAAMSVAARRCFSGRFRIDMAVDKLLSLLSQSPEVDGSKIKIPHSQT